MAIQYIVREYKDPQNPMTKGKYYAKSVSRGKVPLREFCQRIATKSGHSRGAVMGILEDILEATYHFMSLGYNVEVGNAGRFQLKVSSEGQEAEQDVDVTKIKKIYPHFQGRYTNYLHLADFEKVVNLYPNVKEDIEPLP